MPATFHTHDRTQMLNALWHFQYQKGYIDDGDVATLAEHLGLSKIEVEGVISFYHFFNRKPAGKYTIYLNNSILSEFAGFAKIREAFERATGARVGQVDPSGQFGFYETSCIGMSDQEPAALINFRPFVRLTPQKVHQIVQNLKAGLELDTICDLPDTNIQYLPPDDRALFFRPYRRGAALSKALNRSPEAILEDLKIVGLSGRGGAFFPIHLKWQSCRVQASETKYIVCNADEGEPGTFKDRVLMQTLPGLLLEGMTLAAYVTGAKEGYIYLRAEYQFLLKQLLDTIKTFKEHQLLGTDILGKEGFDFNIKIQLGAGAYVCGEETAMLQSMEGHRGEPRTKIRFPTERGYHQQPTVVNNVETLMAATRIIEVGANEVRKLGTVTCPGNKVLSVAGDCTRPGIYEIEWGMKLGELLDLCGAQRPWAVQLSGPSGELVPATYTDREISRDDLACGGSVMIFNQDRDLMQVLLNYNRFFMHESCGICTPCRGGNYILNRKLLRIQQGLADRSDLQQLHDWGEVMQYSSRCGLGKTAPNSILQAIERFPAYFNRIVALDDKNQMRAFDLEGATAEYDQITKK